MTNPIDTFMKGLVSIIFGIFVVAVVGAVILMFLDNAKQTLPSNESKQIIDNGKEGVNNILGIDTTQLEIAGLIFVCIVGVLGFKFRGYIFK